MNRLVVMFGGSGFVGRYIAQALLAQGARVRFAERDPKRAWFLKPQGNLGQTQFVAADITKPDSVARAVHGADAVINLVGILKGNFQKIHVDGARTVAEAAAAAGVSALVQMSAIGADPESPSAYGRSKGAGEAAVRAAFPAATILRPSIIFGREDQFVNRFANMVRTMPLLPVIRSETRFQPAYVGDVAQAAVKALLDPEAHAGKTYELGGPQILTMGELNAWIAAETGYSPAIVPVPDAFAKILARLPGGPMSWDQWLMLQRDNVAAAGSQGFAELGVSPTPLAAVAPGWLVKYRRNGRFGAARKVA